MLYKNKFLPVVLAATLAVGACGAAGCSKATDTGTDKAASSSSQTSSTSLSGQTALSAAAYDFDGEYAYGDFNAHSQADTERQGVDTYENTDVVFQIVGFEELCRILESEGNYLIEFGGGSWCHNTRAFSAECNKIAKEYGVDTIYTFDFDFDNDPTGKTFLRMTNGTDMLGAKWNYIYGEICSRYLANLNDWVQVGQESSKAITYTNAAGTDITLPRLQEPYLMLYNKDNTVDYSGNGHDGQACPVVRSFEVMVDRDANGIYLKQTDSDGKETGREYITESYEAQMREFFDAIKGQKLSTFDEAAYLKQAYGLSDGENLDLISYTQLTWLLGQEGSALIVFADPSDTASKEMVAAAQKQAKAAGAKVYVFDPILDNGMTAAWGYGNEPNILANADLTYMMDDLVSSYMNNGSGIKLGSFFAYNSKAVDSDRITAPVFSVATSASEAETVVADYKATL